MHRASEHAAEFNQTLAQLAERLATHDIVVSRLHADWSSFGSWELHVERGSEADRYVEGIGGPDPMRAIGPEVLRCFWDGRDHYLMIETSPTRTLSAPNEWRKEHAQGFDSSEEAVHFLGDYLRRRFHDGSRSKA